MKALVTGGAGFIGSHIVDLLIERGIETYVLRSGFRSFKHPELVNKDAIVLRGDLLDAQQSLVDCLDGIDIVIHCGAVMSHYADLYPELMFDVNVKGMWKLKLACHDRGVKKIIFASTSFVYGDPTEMPVTEITPPNPKGIFEVSKLAGEKILQATYPFQVPYVILRLFNVYGPRSYPDGIYSQAITTFIGKALRKESIEVHDKGRQMLDFVYVKDVAEAFYRATNCSYNAIYNVGSGKATSVLTLAKTINKLTGNTTPIHFNEGHPAYLHTVEADIARIDSDLGWHPKTDLKTGLKETIEFFKPYFLESEKK